MIKLYHWSLNPNKILSKGFPIKTDRNSVGMLHNTELGVWCTDQIVGRPEDIKPELKILIIDVPEKDIIQYEEINKNASYRAFRIPSSVINKYKITKPLLYQDRGIFKVKD